MEGAKRLTSSRSEQMSGEACCSCSRLSSANKAQADMGWSAGSDRPGA